MTKHHPRPDQTRRTPDRWGFFACLLVLLISTARAEPDPKGVIPPLEFVQSRLWNNMRLQDFKLEGVIRTPKKTYPITLRTRDREMIYEFKDRPLQLRVIISPVLSSIERRSNASDDWKEITGTERTKPILDTDITYEDLCLDFIRWDNVHPIGTDSIKTLSAWAFEARPDGISLYDKVRYWISSDFFAFLRVDAYNKQGQVIKRVEVNGVQQIGQAYVIKEMQISTLIPGRELSSSRTYVEIHEGKPGSGM